ncbi:hypothetical protein A1O3_04268 [Capronia epimyces CBS 606.96]|uniref:Zn(2)-C6 fungal-type domain-containing protein n=1 Tax=Capronia epimyces CBS 606.96 TaxID=1182542 RepID=W9YYD8_9EURO|nr:uncharacterized protein A1O3_04268 [Capronia epimyces CBS 606.96]EXJ87309.1 hypothetical protein A1O3_04268 [Capronia epimyces CBS 606.96]
MEVDPSDQAKAAQACVACRKQKRRCDKAFPSCGLCVRMSRPCDYTDTNSSPSADDFAILQQKITDLEARLEGRRSDFGWYEPIRSISKSPATSLDSATLNDSSGFSSAAFFLDAEVFVQAQMSIPRLSFAVPSDVIAILGTSICDIHEIVDRYFANVHTWLPFISKKRMELTLSNPSLDLSADFALLLLSMKLIIQVPAGGPQSVRSPLYALTKRYFATVESSGLLSLHTLQADILVAAYEIGQAIYPAAYLTTGHCARMGHGLGLHDRTLAPQYSRKRMGSWAETEEAKRTWWATMLLDRRYVNSGAPGRPLATDDPSRRDVLPADDQMWDAGEMATGEPLYVSSPTNVIAGPFARTCQATHLLGRLIRLANDQLLDSPLRFTEAIHLFRTLQALANLLQGDAQQLPERYGTALALCCSALLRLSDRFACTETNGGNHTVEETEMQTLAISGMKGTAADALQFSQLLMLSMIASPAATSPLIGDCLYMAAATYAWLAHESGLREMGEAYHQLRKSLETMNCRWAVASQYLGLLDKAKETLYPDCLLL